MHYQGLMVFFIVIVIAHFNLLRIPKLHCIFYYSLLCLCLQLLFLLMYQVFLFLLIAHLNNFSFYLFIFLIFLIKLFEEFILFSELFYIITLSESKLLILIVFFYILTWYHLKIYAINILCFCVKIIITLFCKQATFLLDFL